MTKAIAWGVVWGTGTEVYQLRDYPESLDNRYW